MTLAPVLTGSGADTLAATSPLVGSDAPVVPGPRETLLSPTPAPQDIEPQTTLVAKKDKNRKIRVDGPRGSRVWTASALASHDLPQAALTAYEDAAAAINRTDPSCQMPWTLLAGIGRVESDHGRYGGSVLSTDGVSRPAIIGIALNGKGPVAAIRDSENGRMDGDKVWDRAVGPMQFIPTTWAFAGRDGDGDGRMNPHDLDDAALAAAGYLCSGSGSMLDDGSATAGIFRYNPSDYYVALVQAFERGYRTGVFVIPSPPPPPDQVDKPRKKRRDRDRTDAPSGDTSTTPKPTPKPKPSDDPNPQPSPTPSPTPSPKPTPKPSPSPQPPKLSVLEGDLSACGAGWCVGGTALDLGPAGQLASEAADDFDGDGTVETNTAELEGLAGFFVTLKVASDSKPAKVYVLEGYDYRYADGSFA
ncbi:MAG: lytic murein transglycosylase [Nocardioides sp.]